MSFPPEVKENLFIACHRRCCICHEFKGNKMEVHHIIQKADGGEDTEENGIPLCLDCHTEVGSYNPKHPKGNKFSPSELKRHKERWFEICKSGLYPLINTTETPAEIMHVGIRSFERRTEDMPDETLCFIDFFDGKRIKDDYDWNKNIFNMLDEFTKKLAPDYSYRLHLDTHLSIAFVAGYLLDSKSGIEIYPMQKTRGKKDWSPEEGYTQDYPKLEEDITTLSDESEDVALVLGIRHNIFDEVKEYILNNQIKVSKIINCNVKGNIGPNAIIDGTHAIELANSVSGILKEGRDTQEKQNNLHIFAACPVGFIFYLGQLSRFFGKVILYEHFDDNMGEIYSKSFELPIISKIT